MAYIDRPRRVVPRPCHCGGEPASVSTARGFPAILRAAEGGHVLQELGDWQDASAIILSCPGPPRRHGAAILPMAGLRLPQILLGSESQLLAFAARAARSPDLASRIFFAPLPEIFAAHRGLEAALRSAGGNPRDPVHLRFGGVRAARVLKGIPNGLVLAECERQLPLTASHHPFATGAVLPAAMQRVFALGPDVLRPRGVAGGGSLPIIDLPADLIDADVQLPHGGQLGRKPASDLDLACLADFRSAAWAAGSIQATLPAPPGAGALLLPWNLDHPGGIVPELLRRLARLQDAGAKLPRIVLLPFNYIGQTGIIRQLIKHVREAPGGGGALLHDVFLARARSPGGIAALLSIARVAWVDGNDPEHWWTLRRLHAIGATTILLDPGSGAASSQLSLTADEPMWVEADTRCGAMIFQARLPSLRTLPGLLRLTAAHQPKPAPRGAPGPVQRKRARAVDGAPA